MINKKSICFFLIIFIALISCSLISAADNSDFNTTTTTTSNPVKVNVADKEISGVGTNTITKDITQNEEINKNINTNSQNTIKQEKSIKSNNNSIRETDDNKTESKNINTNTNKAKDLTSTKTLKTTDVTSASDISSTGTYYLTQNITLSKEITANDGFILNGNGYTIDCGQTSGLTITGTVIINNVILKNINGAITVNQNAILHMTSVAIVNSTSSTNLMELDNPSTTYLTNVLFDNNKLTSSGKKEGYLIHAGNWAVINLKAVSFKDNNLGGIQNAIGFNNHNTLNAKNVYYSEETGIPELLTDLKNITEHQHNEGGADFSTYDSIIDVTNDTVYIGETGYVNVTLSTNEFNIPYTTITYTIDDGEKQTVTTDFTGRIIIPVIADDLNPNPKIVKITYDGEKLSDDTTIYGGISGEGHVTINKLPTNIIATNVTGKTNTEVTTTVTVKDMNGNIINEGQVVLRNANDIISTINLSDNTVITYIPTIATRNNYTVEYLGTDDKYDASSTTIISDIERQEAKISSQDVNGYVQQELTIPVTVTDESGNAITEGTVDLIQDGQTVKTIDLSSETITITPQQEGTTKYTLRYNQNGIYTESTADINVVVSKRDTETKASVLNNTVENVTIDVTVTDTSVSGEVVDMGTVVITNGETEVGRGTVSNGKATIKTEIAEINQYDLKVTYLSNDKYTTSSDDTSLANLDVVGKTAGISGLSDGNKIGHSSVVVTLIDAETGEAISGEHITVLNGQNTVTTSDDVTDSEGKLTIPLNLGAGSYTLTVRFDGNTKYAAVSDDVPITIGKHATSTSAVVDNSTVGNLLIDVTVTDDDYTDEVVSNGTVEIVNTDDNNRVVGTGKIVNGKVTINVTDIESKGTYNLQANYLGNDYYFNSDDSQSTNNIKNTEVIGKVSDVTGTVTSDVIGKTGVKITLVDSETGTLLNGETVTVKEGDTTLGEGTITDGEVTLPVDLTAGKHTLTISYDGNNIYAGDSDTVTIDVAKRNTTTTATVTNNTARNVVIDVTVTDTNYPTEVVSKGTVHIMNDKTEVGQGTVVNGKVTIKTNITDIGKYNLNIVYDENDYYLGSNDADSLSDLDVIGKVSSISGKITSNIIGKTTVEVTLIDPETNTPISDATIKVKLPNGTIITGKETTNSEGKVVIPVDIPVGENILNISFDGNTVYAGSSQNVPANVVKRNTTTTATAINTTVGNVLIDVTVTDTTTGETVTNGSVEIKNGDKVVGIGTITDGKVTINVTGITIKDTYNLVVNYTGNDYYYNSSDVNSLANLKVVGKDSFITANVTGDTSEDTKVNVKLVDPETNNPLSDADIIVTLPNGTNITGKTNRTGEVSIPVDIPVGDNTLNVTYLGNETYNGSNTTVDVDVNKLPSTTIANVVNNVVNNVIVNVKVTDKTTGEIITSGNVNITVGDAVVGRGVLTGDGTVIITTSITEKGTYDLVVNYEGNDKYTESSYSLNDVTVVGKTSEIKVNVTNKTVGNTTVNITLVDPDDNTPIPDANITVTLPNGTDINRTTDENGTVIIPVDIPVGPNDINITYPGNETYNGTNTTVNIDVTKRPSSTTATVTDNVATRVTVDVKVTDKVTGTPVTSGNVNIALPNGTVVGKGVLTEDGTVTILTTITEKGIYDLIINYGGNTNYTESSTTLNDVTVVGKTSEIKVNVTNKTVGNTTVNITLVDPDDDTPIPDANITVTLPNGTEVNGTTNENGTVEIPVDIPVGPNDINITYPGNETYNGTNTTVPVNISKRPSSTSATIANTTAGNVVVDVKVTDAITDASVTSGNVYISTADGAIIGTGVLSNDGTVTITTNINKIGSYDLVVTFEGNENYTESDTTLNDITINGKTSSITATIANNTLGNTSVDVTLVDPETETPISNAEIIVTLPDGTNVTGTTNTTGEVTIPVNVPVGDNTLNVTYLGDKIYSGSNATVNVNVAKRPSQTSATIANNTATNSLVDVKVVDAVTGNVVTSGNININLINGTCIGIGEVSSNGTATIRIGIENIGTYNLVVEYLGNANYTESSTTLNDLTITGKESSITATVENKTYGNTTVDVTLVDPETNTPISNATIIVTLPNGTDVNGTTNENGTAEIPVDIPVGDNTLNVTYPGDDVYNGTNTTVNVNVAKRPSSTSATIANATAGNVVVDVKVTDAITDASVTSGNVYISTADGAIIGTGVLSNDGTVSITTSINNIGIYDLVVYFEGNTNYTESETTLNDITVSGKTSSITATIANNTLGNTSVDVTLVDPETDTPISNAEIIVTLPDGTNVTGTTNTTGEVTIPVDIPVGDNTLNVTYPGDNVYNGTNTTVNVNVAKRPSSTSATIANTTAGNVVVDVKVTDKVTGKTVTSGNVDIKLVNGTLVGRGELASDGTVSITTTIANIGLYDLVVSYLGNDNYTESETALNSITVTGKESSITADVENKTYGNTTVDVTLVDPETNTPISNATIIVTLPNGTKVNGTTNENGTAEIPVDIPVGDNTLNVTYPGDDVYNGTNTTVNVNVAKRPSTTTGNIINNIAGNVTVDVKVTDTVTGSPVTSGNVNVALPDGRVVGRGIVSVDGTVEILTTITEKGTYDLTINYEGNTNYTESSTTLKDIVIVGKNTEIITNITNNTKGNTTINITIVDPDDNTPVPDANITVTLPNGTEINGTTDENGTVEIPVDIPVGPNDINITYPGNETYNGTNTTVPIDVNKRPSQTTATVTDNVATRVTIDVKVTDKVTGVDVTSGKVNITVDGVVVGTGELRTDGTATILTSITEKGTYNFVVNYEGNTNYTESSTTLNDVTVVGRNTEIITNITNNIKGNTTINITIVDPDDNTPVPDANITVTLPNGTEINGTTDENGTVEIPVDIPVGPNDINITYPGNETYNGTNTTVPVDVNKRASTTNASVINNVAGNVTVDVKVVDTVTGSPVTSGNVNVTLPDGTIVGRGELSVNGTVIITTNITQKGTYNLTVNYEGNENYTESSDKLNDITIVGRNSNITVIPGNTTVGNTTVNVTIVDPDTNETIPNATVIVTLPNGTEVNGTTDENGTVEIPVDIPAGDNNITITYPGNETYNGTNTTVNVNVHKIGTTVTVEPIKGIVGEVITLTAHVTDINGNLVNGGNLVFKLNGKTLRVDGSFNSTAAPLKLHVVNGTVTYNIIADLYLRNTKNITASYSGSWMYEENRSTASEAQIAKRYAAITVNTINSTKQDTDITFNANIKDITSNTLNTTALDGGYVIFKLNGNTLKDANGTEIRVAVTNNTANLTYHVPRGMASIDSNNTLRDYNVTAVYSNKVFYPTTRNTTQFNVQKSPITINFANVTVNNNTRVLNIIGNITDENGNLVVGTNKICVKINNKTIRNSTNQTLFFTVQDGRINLTYNLPEEYTKFNNIQIVTGDRQAYTSGRSNTSQIVIV